MRTAKLTVLLPPDQKAEVEQKASAMGISTDEFVRRAVNEYETVTPEQEAELALLVEQVNVAIPEMAASFDRMSKMVRETRAHMRQTRDLLRTPA